MLTYLVAFLLSALCALVLTPRVRDIALARGAVDAGTEQRKVHDRPIPRVGGIAIAAAFFVPVLGLFFWDNQVSQAYLSHLPRFIGLVGGSSVLIALGLVDDLRGLRARHKLAVQIAVASGAWFLGYQILRISNPWGDPIALGWLGFPITVLWIVGIVNAFNLIDGLDGLATGMALFTVGILFILGVVNESRISALTAVAMGGALLGFLRYNFNPASIFMGDSGSLFIGYVLSITAISGATKSSTVVTLLVPLLAMGVPVADTLLTVIRRILAGRHPFEADRGHLHHRLLDSGLTHRDAVLVIYATAAALAFGALMLVYANSLQTAAILGTLVVAALTITWFTGAISWGGLRETVRYGLMRQRGLRERLTAIEATATAIREAPTVDRAVDTLLKARPALDIDQIHLTLRVGSDRPTRTWTARDGKGLAEGYERKIYALDWSLGDVHLTGALELGWDCPPAKLLVPDAPALAYLATALRDRVLELSQHDNVHDFRPRIVTDPGPTS